MKLPTRAHRRDLAPATMGAAGSIGRMQEAPAAVRTAARPMSYVDSAASSHERATFWSRPHSLMLTWPVLFALLLLLLLAGVIAITHQRTPRRRQPAVRGHAALPYQSPSQ